jgi:hypothetical protein
LSFSDSIAETVCIIRVAYKSVSIVSFFAVHQPPLAEFLVEGDGITHKGGYDGLQSSVRFVLGNAISDDCPSSYK